jgi:peptidyl-Lys metalloendopeptidase
MRRITIGTLVFALWGSAAAAQNFMDCAKDEIRIYNDAMRNAKELTLKAATAVGDTPEFSRWFGTYSRAHAEEVRANLKAVVSAIRSGAVTAQCNATSADGCEGGTYAWVYADEPYLLHLCPPFFNLPPLTALRPGMRSSDDGTREGTIVHELSHFNRVARTEDHCYSRSECSDMARNSPARAVDNADSYQYFTEDVTYYARRPVTGKPPAASRSQ